MDTENKELQRKKIHQVLIHSYVTYFALFLVGVVLSIFFKFKIFKDSIMVPIGVLIILFATVLIFSAQKAGRDFKKHKKTARVTTEHFKKGPYRYTKTPTQFGLLFLILGFGIIANSFFIILSTILSFIVSKFIFVSKQNQILIEKYGDPYLEYRNTVKF